MHPSRIFEKPIGFYENPPPPLQVVGALPGYEQGQSYEGRLDIINAIGDCVVELLDNNLPPGHTVMVDQAAKQVVIRWPPYTPVIENRSILNWNFELGSLEGWHDLRGGSWSTYVYDRHTPGNKDIPYQAPDGNIAAKMEGIGRGDHILESDRYPAVPGQAVSASSLWYQGPSNKDNNNLWTAIVFYGPGGQSLEVRGDRIHDRTNKRRHFSTVNTTTPAWAETKAVRLIAHRRNRRNRLINVDDVVTSGFSYSTGVDNGDDFHLCLRVRDSANRVATWCGIVPYGSFFVTSRPYGLVEEENLFASFEPNDFVLKVGQTQAPPQGDVLSASFGIQGFVLRASLTAVEEHENIGVSFGINGFTLRAVTVRVTQKGETVTAAFGIQGFVLKQHPHALGTTETVAAAFGIQGFTLGG